MNQLINMKKIMFNDKYGLTESVLNGTKTQTRRVVTEAYTGFGLPTNIDVENMIHFEYQSKSAYAKPLYIVDEVVAVAQRYTDFRMPNGDVTNDFYKLCCKHHMPFECLSGEVGMTNKMFVKAELMPHHIRITNIRIERLQDISDEDCLAEGISRVDFALNRGSYSFRFENEWYKQYHTPREAYATLIDKFSGKGAWDSNPYVFVYEFVKVD